MSEDRRRILDMLATGRITAEEAERLLDAVGAPAPRPSAALAGPGPKYLVIQMEKDRGDGRHPKHANVRVPLQLLRAGVRLASLIPAQAHDQLDEALSKHGVPITLSQIKPENLEELIDHLEDLTVDVNGTDGNMTKVRVFCE